jgi:hypothetical protein
MTCSHLILCQRASLITGNASCAAQSLNSLKILDKNIHVLHLDSSESESDGELIPQVRPQQKEIKRWKKGTTCGSSPSGTFATMIPMAKISACGKVKIKLKKIEG